ncbi:MAG: ROK family transcriptional regulator [Devosiaceae bacterium]|nr:ROK family transcriptional regulator [Devosiaceae bacterium MH13]
MGEYSSDAERTGPEDAEGPRAPDTLPTGYGPMLGGSARATAPLRNQVFDTVRAAGRIARADLARALGISAGSVTSLTSDLLAQGLLREVSAPVLRDTTRGRPPVALEIVPDTRLVVGIKLSDERHTAVLSDVTGETIASAHLPAEPGRLAPDALCDVVETLTDTVLAEAGLRRDALAGVGIGLAGMIDHEAGNVHWSPLLLHKDVPLRDAIAKRLELPTEIENDVNVLTLAELWFGKGRTRRDFIVVTVEGGVGMGSVIDGALYRGGRGLGLEFGHTKVHLDGALCRCGQRGCLEAYLADYALAREASTALGRMSLDGGAPKLGAQAMLDALFVEAKAGNSAARSVFRRAGRYLSLGLANLVQLFDPPLIILSGARMRYDYLYADEVIKEMGQLLLSTERSPPEVEIHAWDDLVWARGAAALALSSATARLLDEAQLVPA